MYYYSLVVLTEIAPKTAQQEKEKKKTHGTPLTLCVIGEYMVLFQTAAG